MKEIIMLSTFISVTLLIKLHLRPLPKSWPTSPELTRSNLFVSAAPTPDDTATSGVGYSPNKIYIPLNMYCNHYIYSHHPACSAPSLQRFKVDGIRVHFHRSVRRVSRVHVRSSLEFSLKISIPSCLCRFLNGKFCLLK
jgi:hypothetical protein